MSTKDTLKAAQMLQNMFGPVVEALPTLITQLEQTDAAEKQLKKLENEYNSLVTKFNAKVDAIDKLDADLAKRNDARQAELKAIEANSTAAIKEMQKKQRELTGKINERQKEVEQVRADSVATIQRIEIELLETEEMLRKASAARVAELDAAAAEAQKRHDDIMKKLEALKAKL